MNLVKEAWSWLNAKAHHRIGVRILQVAVGLMLAFRIATEFRYAAYLWGPHGIGVGSETEFFGARLGYAFDGIFAHPFGITALLIALFAAAVMLVTGTATRVATALALFIVVLLEHRSPELLDGGDNITRIVLAYMLFLQPTRATARPGSVATVVHNVAVMAIIGQLCVVYLTAGFMKATGVRWSQGTAMYLISQVRWFSTPLSARIFSNPVTTTVASYATIFFQLWFPVALLIPRLRIPWVLVGVSFHLGIAVFMGLIPFSTVMSGLELFVLSDAELLRSIERLKAAGRLAWAYVGPRLNRQPVREV